MMIPIASANRNPPIEMISSIWTAAAKVISACVLVSSAAFTLISTKFLADVPTALRAVAARPVPVRLAFASASLPDPAHAMISAIAAWYSV